MLLWGVPHRTWGKDEGNGSSAESALKQLAVLTAHDKLLTRTADVTLHTTRRQLLHHQCPRGNGSQGRQGGHAAGGGILETELHESQLSLYSSYRNKSDGLTYLNF